MRPATSAEARVREAGGDELFERLASLDASRGSPKPAPRPPKQAPDAGAQPDYDAVIAGGGLSLLLAPLLADRGLRVAILDRARVGGAHREWNAGEAELRALVASGLFTDEEVSALVVARYAYGVCRWHGGGSYPVKGVLDCAIDAGAILSEARRRAEASGVTILDKHTLVSHAEGRGGVELSVAVRAPSGESTHTVVLSTRVLVDARGAASPYATADLVCPTVGGVLAGLEEGDAPDAMRRDVGEILATTEGVEGGRQHLWEAFPGRGDETTVYLFYYARSSDVPRGSLLELYARFFELLPRYKRGAPKLVRPTFGYIPGWSRLCDPPTPPGPRVILVGDAAARHSPLTFCGFGSTVRSLSATASSIARAAADPTGRARSGAMCDAPIHAGTGALAALMASPPRASGRRDDLNRLLDAAFATLHAMGDESYGALLRDEMSTADFVRFLRATAARRPRVYREIFSALRPGALGLWGIALAKELARGAGRERATSEGQA